jgi:hypothetical protein
MKEERRTHARVRMELPALCVITDNEEKIKKEITTCNLSDTGICFFADQALKTGEIIQIQIPAVLDIPKTCVVRWCTKEKGGFYKVGASFWRNEQNSSQ